MLSIALSLSHGGRLKSNVQARREYTMARIREALRRTATQRIPPLDKDLTPRPFHPDEEPARTEAEEEVPFIEVGGRQTPVEASPSVLASMPQTPIAATAQEEPDRPLPLGQSQVVLILYQGGRLQRYVLV
jgi:hypothetical protein